MITPAYTSTATERVLPRLALDFTTGVLDPRVTVARALNTATRVNSSGLVETVNADLPRFDYDPTTFAPKGLLIEETRTNVLTYSADFTQPAWVLDNSGATDPVVTADQGIAPDGTMTADRIVFDKTGGVFSRIQQGSTSASAVHTFSVWMRTTSGIGVANVGVRLDGTAKNCVVTGTWSRFFVSLPSPASNPTAQILLFDSIPGNDDVADVLVWGAQLELGSFATSYIPTTTTSVTRNADVVSMTGTNFSSWYNASQGAFVAWFDTVSPAGVGYIYSANAGGSIGDSIFQTAYADTTDNYVLSGGVQQARLLSGVITANTRAKTGLRYANASFATAANGGSLQSQLSGSLPVGIDRLHIGYSAGGGNFLNGHIAELLWYTSLTNAELVAFTK